MGLRCVGVGERYIYWSLGLLRGVFLSAASWKGLFCYRCGPDLEQLYTTIFARKDVAYCTIWSQSN